MRVSRTGSDSSGAAIATYPASARNAAREQSVAAPVVPRAPPTTSTEPALYLLSDDRLRGTSRRISRATSRCSVSVGSRPMSATTISPAWKRPGATASPIFGPCMVTVTSAQTAAPATSPVDAFTPDGMSTASTGATALLICSISRVASSRGAPFSPVPRSASITTSGCSSTISRPCERRISAAIWPSPPFAPPPA